MYMGQALKTPKSPKGGLYLVLNSIFAIGPNYVKEIKWH
jgi:hypothetical protein